MFDIISESHADTDYAIGYYNGLPVAIVEEFGTYTYYGVVRDGEYVECPYDGQRWFCDDGTWEALSNTLPVNEYIERNINDGDQIIIE